MPQRSFGLALRHQSVNVRDIFPVFYHLLTQYHLVFVLAQESARQVKAWYESSDKAR